MTKTVIIPSNPVDQKKILSSVKEADACLLRIASERDRLKAIVEDMVETFPDIGKKYFNRLIKTYHKQNFDAQSVEADDFSELYTAIVK